MSTTATAPADAPAYPATLSVEQTGRLFELSRSSTYRACQRGEIPTIRFGRTMRVPTARVLAMLGLDELPVLRTRSAPITTCGSSA